ncbi:MAG: hypothetical protein LBE09_00285, partial [Christensenellaceae bacterium]|nr:hypothetical protein [Christensenellaceae bacterium]
KIQAKKIKKNLARKCKARDHIFTHKSKNQSAKEKENLFLEQLSQSNSKAKQSKKIINDMIITC